MFLFLLVFYIKASYVYTLICSGSTTPSYVLTNYQINGVLSSTQTTLDVCACENLCSSDANCIAIDFNNGICNLVASSTLPYASQGTVSNQACVDPANACTGTYQFNQYQNYALIGYARQAITTTTIDQCYSECLNAVTLYGFNCTSGMWFDPTDCILNYDNQFTQASSFAYDPTNGDYYFDKICTPDCLTTTTASTIAPTTTTASTTAPTTTTASTTASTTSQCCQIGGFWSDWENSGTCNDTCGSCGQILRTRTCLSSTWCPCSGPSTRLDNCNIAPCAYPRLSCCTPYKAISVNNSIICGPQPTPFEPKPIVTGCMPDCCPAQGVWSQWSDPIGCSDTCGACGLATQQRYCMTSGNGCPCNGNDIQSVPCNLTPCKYPRNSCCIGKIVVMNESMICTVPTSTESPASLDCASSCCPSGGAWSAWSTSQTCSDTCGSCGQLKYTRTCTSEPTCPCNGESSKSVNCNFTPCKFPRTSCCGSYKAMVVDGVIICGPQPIESSDTESSSSPNVCTSTSIPISTSTFPGTTVSTSVATTSSIPQTTSTSTPMTATSTSTLMITTSTSTPMTTDSTSTLMTTTSTSTPISTSTPMTTTATSTPMATTSTSTPMATTSTSTPMTTDSTSTPMTTDSTSTLMTTTSTSTPMTTTATSIPMTTDSTSTLMTTTSTSTPISTSTPMTTTATSTPMATTSTSTPMTTTATSTPMTTDSTSTLMTTTSTSTPISTSTPMTTTATSTPMATTSTSTPMATTATSTPMTTDSTSTLMTTTSTSTAMTTTSCTCAQAQIPTTNNTNVSVSPNQATYTCGTVVYYYCNSTNNYNPCYYTSYQYPNGTVTTASIYCGGVKGYSYRYETCNSQYMFITFTCLYVDCRRFPC